MAKLGQVSFQCFMYLLHPAGAHRRQDSQAGDSKSVADMKKKYDWK
jgi:hypothetical protein